MLIVLVAVVKQHLYSLLLLAACNEKKGDSNIFN